MKISKFKVAIYDWTVTLIQIESVNDALKFKDQITKVAKSNHLTEEQISELLSDCNEIKGGAQFYSAKECYKALIVLYRDQSYIKAVDCICHEKRHLEDYILEQAHIDDKEAAGYLAGYLASELFPLLIIKNRTKK